MGHDSSFRGARYRGRTGGLKSSIGERLRARAIEWSSRWLRPTATGNRCVGLDEFLDRVVVGEQLEGLFEALEMVRADQHRRGPAVAAGTLATSATLMGSSPSNLHRSGRADGDHPVQAHRSPQRRWGDGIYKAIRPSRTRPSTKGSLSDASSLDRHSRPRRRRVHGRKENPPGRGADTRATVAAVTPTPPTL